MFRWTANNRLRPLEYSSCYSATPKKVVEQASGLLANKRPALRPTFNSTRSLRRPELSNGKLGFDFAQPTVILSSFRWRSEPTAT
jgi:hypothetical protein